MLCPEFETRLCDYLDGTLDQASAQEAEQHASECALCAALLADATAVGQFLERVEPVEAPQELVTSILYRTRQAHSRATGWRSWFQPLLQPRFAMSMAMTILSVSMLYRVAGVQIRQLEVSDLNPVAIWQSVDNSAQRMWNRAVKFYQNARFIYEIVSQWKELQAEEDQEASLEPAAQTRSGQQPPGQQRKVEPSPAPGRRK